MSTHENYQIGYLYEIKQKSFWQAVLTELIAVAILVSVGCGSCVPTDSVYYVDKNGLPETGKTASVIRISLTFGFLVTILVSSTASISGGHLNPSVSLGLFIARRISVFRLIFYTVAQILGAILGALFIKMIYIDPPGANLPNPEFSLFSSVCLESLVNFVLVITVLSCTDDKRTDTSKLGSIPLTIGMAIACCHLFAADATGSAMNPARAFGPALIYSTFKNHWIYWIGGLIGSISAALIYEYLVMAPDISLQKIKLLFFSESNDLLSSPVEVNNNNDIEMSPYVVNSNHNDQKQNT